MKKSLMALTCAVTLALTMQVVADDLSAASTITLTNEQFNILMKQLNPPKDSTLVSIGKKISKLVKDPQKATLCLIAIAIMYRMASKKPVQNPTQFPALQAWSAKELANYLTTLYFWAEDKVIAPKGQITEESKDGLDDKTITIQAGGLNKVVEKIAPMTKVIATCKTIKDIGDVVGLVVA